MARTPDPLTNEQYTALYLEALKKKGVLTVPAAQALKDREAWPELSANDAGFKRAELQWDAAIDATEPPVAQVSDAVPHQRTKAEVDALAQAGRISDNGDVIPAKRAEAVGPKKVGDPIDATAPQRSVVPTRQFSVMDVKTATQYVVGSRTFTEKQDALDYAFVTMMEEVLGVPLDIDVLKENAELIHALTGDYLGKD